MRTMTRTMKVAIGVLLSGVLLSCTPATVPIATPTPAQKETVIKPTISKQSWEVEWEKAIGAAKSEGKVVLYSNAGGDVRIALTQSFQEKYGLELEWVAGNGTELAQKLYQERNAGLYLADMWLIGGSVPVTDLKPKGVLDSIKPVLLLPEVTDPQLWYGGKPHFADKEGEYVLSSLLYPTAPMIINTEQVKVEEVKSYRNLLEPRWKGKIVIHDPTKPGTGGRWFSVMVGGKIMDVEFMRQLVKQEPLVIKDQRLQVEWIARGKYPIAIGAKTDVAVEFIKMAAPVKRMTPVEGTDLTGGSGLICLINRAPHPNATKVFINWYLSKEGQTLYSKIKLAQSARMDIKVDGIPEEELRDPVLKYFISEREEFLSNEAVNFKLASEIFGTLLK